MSVDDTVLVRLLLDRGLLTPEEHEEAEEARRATGRPLVGLLVEKSFLSAAQVKDALAALEKRVRFCGTCNAPVYVTSVRTEGEVCLRCQSPVQWREEAVVARIQDVESLVQLTRDELPEEVKAARSSPGKLFGKYILLSELGRGGAAVVQKAWDTMLGEYVALKFIKELADLPDSGMQAKRVKQEQIKDLLQEARSALRLRHPNIVAMRDLGRIDEQYYIAMDYIEGKTLAEQIHAARGRGRISPLYEEPRKVLRIMRDISNAIHYAHTFPKPIVHCDLKPGNVLISTEGTGYVMDFGLARAVGGGHGADGGEKIRGTPAYMAPEQLSGRAEEIGVWTDVYALGATLYELLSGQPAFIGEPLEVLAKAAREAPEKPTRVLRRANDPHHRETTRILARISRLEGIVLKCLEKDPAKRYATARQVTEELETVLEAVKAGRDTGMVPESVREADERSELERVDEHLTRLDLGKALEEAERLEKTMGSPQVRTRVDHRRRQVVILQRMRARMIDRLNEARPTFPKFKLVQGELRDVEVLKAGPDKLYLLAEGELREMEWTSLSPEQTLDMAEAVRMTGPEDRLALGILCHHAHLSDRAVRFLTALKGTAFEEEARPILESET